MNGEGYGWFESYEQLTSDEPNPLFVAAQRKKRREESQEGREKHRKKRSYYRKKRQSSSRPTGTKIPKFMDWGSIW